MRKSASLPHSVFIHVFLIDHAWTFEASSMRQSLLVYPSLVGRMAELMSLNQAGANQDALIDAVCQNVWRFCRYYKVSVEMQQATPQPQPSTQSIRWYVPDEVGARIGHSDRPTGRMVPFFYLPRGICYSVLWLTCDLQEGDELKLDFVEHIKDPALRPYYLLPWYPANFSDEPVEHSYVLSEEFFQSHRIQETMPSMVSSVTRVADKNKPLTVYTNIGLVAKYLTDDRFRLVSDQEGAAVLWLYEHFKSFKELTENPKRQLVNQYPGEQVITVKDLLAAIASLSVSRTVYQNETQDAIDSKLTSSWYPVTFNLVHELPAFVAYFQRKQEQIDAMDPTNPPACTNESCPRTCHFSSGILTSERNLWILKPWNLGRGLGIHISDNLSQIIRLTDTNPLIASRYVTDPVLFYRADIDAMVKFDIRYVVFLRSVQPLKLFAYNVFWLRFANKAFRLSDFEDYGRHFTVMNYQENDRLKQIHYDEFIQLFNEQYPTVTWTCVQDNIFKTIVDLFMAATAHPAPRGLVPCEQSRALYAVDLLLEWRSEKADRTKATTCHHMHPIICEVNYSPDCERACKYHPDFFNHAFSCLFLDEAPEKCNVTQLI